VLTFTFDDGYIGHYSKAKPYMDKYGYKGTYGPIIDLIGSGSATTGYMSNAQLLALRDDGWDCAVHAYRSAVHNSYSTQTDAAIEADVQQAKAYLRAAGLGPADTFLIPQGQMGSSDNWTQIWKRYFQTGRSSYQKVRETYPPARRLGLRCQSCDSGISVALVNAAIDEAVTNKEWIILKTHNIVDSAASGTDILTASFQSVVDHVASSGIKVRTLREVSNTGLN
jgi:peptidoglycan/xylan/chitin deacetylase (PgdA/CDA1 family)